MAKSQRLPLHVRTGKQLDDGRYAVNYYERMGNRYVPLGNTENWASKADAKEHYGGRFMKGVPIGNGRYDTSHSGKPVVIQPNGGMITNSN